ncbi:MAG: outer membrane lipoprotein-sorting protein [Candidatus Margulisbacteria bacterium]|nr:outer membrane lipoprotein-sorting protein [Candidatus Margulisiibacteriota bacterium]MBU1616745.1 outer membrane lipoprotein-sorting protein [Candidatus Margulisiibacteriota bacterium]
MKRLIALLLFMPGIALAVALSPAEKALVSLDDNYTQRTTAMTMRLFYKNDDEQRTADLEFFASGNDRSLIEVKNQGGRYLKLGDRLLIYSAASGGPVKLTGRIFERSFLGSAFSFADLMFPRSFADVYTGQITTSETISFIVPQGTGEAVEEHDCLVMTLTASRRRAPAYRKMIWIDREIEMVVREKDFALSGRLLKTIEYGDFRKVKKRYYPAYLRAEDPARGGVASELFIDQAEFDRTLPAGIFNP